MDFGAWVSAAMQVVSRHSAAEWTVVCPRCAEEKLAVNVKRRAFQCWRCGFSGYDHAPAVLIMAVLDCHPAEAGQVCAQYASGLRSLGRVGPLDEDIVARRTGPPPVAPAPPGTTWGQLDPHAANYAHGRGIPSDHAYRFGLCSVRGDGSGSTVDFMTRGRLLVPVWLHGRFVYWVARATGPSDVKTVNLPESCNEGTHPKGPPCRGTPDCTCRHERWGLSPVPQVAGKVECLVGHHLLEKGKPAYLVEGPMDAAMCGPGFVGVMGSTLALEQAFLLVEAGVSEVVILFDGDDAGFKGAKQAYDLLSPLVSTRVGEVPAGRDPGDLGRAACLTLAERASGGVGPPPLVEVRERVKIARELPAFIKPL